MFKERVVDVLYGGLAALLWLATWGLVRGLAALQNTGVTS